MPRLGAAAAAVDPKAKMTEQVAMKLFVRNIVFLLSQEIALSAAEFDHQAAKKVTEPNFEALLRAVKRNRETYSSRRSGEPGEARASKLWLPQRVQRSLRFRAGSRY